ncbi:hypothetical protein CR513_61747, partial [Mucuna pruriens]
MTARTKVDVHAGTLSMEFDSHSDDIDNFVEKTDLISSLGPIPKEEADYTKSGEVHNLSNSEDNNNDIADLDFEAELIEVIDQVCKHENPECSIEVEVQTISAKEDQKQAEANFISNYQGENCVPTRFDYKTACRTKSDSNLTRTDSIKRSRPQQKKAEIMSAHLVSSAT